MAHQDEGSYPWSYERHRRRQARTGLHLTPAERLRWLEETMDEMRKLVGRASRTDRRTPPRSGPDPSR